MTNPINKALADLIQTVNELNREDFTVFLRYSGHVQSVEVHYYAGGYENNPKNGTYLSDCYIHDAFNNSISDEQVAEGIEELRLELIEASENNEKEFVLAKAKAEAADRAKYEELKAKFEKENTK